MTVDLSIAIGLSPSIMLRRLEYWKKEKAKGETSSLGRCGFSDVFDFVWEQDPFSVNFTQVNVTKPNVIPLEPNWLEKVLKAAQIESKDLKDTVKGKFVCVFQQDYVNDTPEMLFVAPYKAEMGPLLNNPERDKTRALVAASQLGSVKKNAWF